MIGNVICWLIGLIVGALLGGIMHGIAAAFQLLGSI